MIENDKHNEKIAKIVFTAVYPCYVTKIERKGRTTDELHQVIKWLTGYDDKRLQTLIDKKVTLKDFFKKAKINKNAHLISGIICGYRIKEIKNPITKNARYLDKLVDELAKGRSMDKVLRK